MITPELVNPETGEYILIAAHCIENDAAADLSIEFNLARLRYAKTHLPPHLTRAIVFYDARGQCVSAAILRKVEQSFAGVCEFRIKR